MPNVVYSVCLSLRLRLSLRLNGQMAIRSQNSHWITIQPFLKSQSNVRMSLHHLSNFIQIWWMVIRRLFCRRITIRPFRLKRQLNQRYFENTKCVCFTAHSFCDDDHYYHTFYWCFACTILDPGRGNRIICYGGKSCRNYILISFISTRIPPTEETLSLCFYELLISSPIKSRWQ